MSQSVCFSKIQSEIKMFVDPFDDVRPIEPNVEAEWEEVAPKLLELADHMYRLLNSEGLLPQYISEMRESRVGRL